MKNEKAFMVLTGLVIGIIAVILVKLGNPVNMGFCIACFERDIAGALGLHRAPIVQYLRPEILGIILGACILAVARGEFRPRGGSNTLVRFFLGMFMMIGALVFLGCPLRDVLRMAGGDYNAIVGFFGFLSGVYVGTLFLKAGFDLGPAQIAEHGKAGGLIMPILAIGLFLLLISGTVFNPEAGGPLFFSKEGPGSMHAPILISLAAGLIVGALAQRARLCLSGGFRDFFLIKDTTLLIAYAFILVGALVLNIAFGFFKPGFADQPVAHTAHIWNFLGLFLVGETAVLLGGCPLRQLILSGEGDMDAGAAVLGMIVGAAVSHNFMLAASPKGVGSFSQIACLGGIVIVSLLGFAFREKLSVSGDNALAAMTEEE